MSSSKEGMILLNILYSFPNRGIWIMKQEGIWENEGKRVTAPEEANPREFRLGAAPGRKGFLLRLFTRAESSRESTALFPGQIPYKISWG